MHEFKGRLDERLGRKNCEGISKQTNNVRKFPALQMVQEQRSIIYTLLETENGTRWDL